MASGCSTYSAPWKSTNRKLSVYQNLTRTVPSMGHTDARKQELLGEEEAGGRWSALWMRPLLPSIVRKGFPAGPSGALIPPAASGLHRTPAVVGPKFNSRLRWASGSLRIPVSHFHPQHKGCGHHWEGQRHAWDRTVTTAEAQRHEPGVGEQGRTRWMSSPPRYLNTPNHPQLKNNQVKTINMEITKVRISNRQVDVFTRGLILRNQGVTWKVRKSPPEIPKWGRETESQRKAVCALAVQASLWVISMLSAQVKEKESLGGNHPGSYMSREEKDLMLEVS